MPGVTRCDQVTRVIIPRLDFAVEMADVRRVTVPAYPETRARDLVVFYADAHATPASSVALLLINHNTLNKEQQRAKFAER